MNLSVGEVARLAGVTVRTLHHYDEIGLLTPSGRSSNGYRRYAGTDLERLQRILVYRELGFGLDEIAAIVDRPRTDALDHLRRQHGLLRGRIERLERMAATVELTMEAHQMGITLDPDEMFEVFGDDDPTQHAEEAEQRWGDSDAYKESQRRTSSYGKEEWLRIKAEGEDQLRRFAAAMAAGMPADSDEPRAAAEAHRQHIGHWFYECSYDVHRALADMYIADQRFTDYYDRVTPGLAQYVRDAIHANADHAAS